MSVRAFLRPSLGLMLAASAAHAQSVANSTTYEPGTPSQPGLSIVNGDYTQTSTGTLQIRLGAPGQPFDQLYVTGTANLNGALQVFAPSNVQSNQTIDILEANNGILGSFSTLSSPSLGLFKSLSVAYDANNVYLTVNQISFASVAKTVNQTAVGLALDSSLSVTGNTFATARDNLGFQTAASAAAELGRIASEGYADATLGGIESSRAFGDALLRAAEDDRGELKDRRKRGWGVWSEGVSDNDHMSDSKLGTANVTGSSNGGAVGVDYAAWKIMRFGAGFGYVNSDVKPATDATSISSRAVQVGMFAMADGIMQTSFIANMGFDNYSFSRVADSGVPATANASGSTMETRLDMTVPYKVVKGWLLAPYFEGDYIRASRGGFQETTSDPFGLSVNQHTSTAMEGDLGAKMGYTIDGDGWRFVPEFRLAGAFEAQKNPFSTSESFLGAPNSAFTILGPRSEQFAARAELSMTYKLEGGFSAFIDYSARADKDNSQFVLGGLKYVF